MPAEVGEDAPDFTLRDENGEEVTLSSLRGQNVVLVFYPLAFSGICTKELHDVTGLMPTSTTPRTRRCFGISVDSPFTLKAFKRDENLKAHLVSDFHPKGAVAQRVRRLLDGPDRDPRDVRDRQGRQGRLQEVNRPGQARDQEEYLDSAGGLSRLVRA